MITSNININELFINQQNQYLYNFNSKFSNFSIDCNIGIVIVSSLLKESIRTPWINTIVNLNDPLLSLYQYKGNQAAGILIIDQKDDRKLLNEYKNIYLKLDKYAKIRCTDEPYKIQDKDWATVYDLYVHNANEYNIVITKVFTDYEAEQLLYLISIAHNYNLKLIVLTNSIENFTQLINKQLNILFYDDDKYNRFDRIKIIFPGIEFKI